MPKVFRLILVSLLFLFIVDRTLGFILGKVYMSTPPDRVAALYQVIERATPFELMILGSSSVLHNVIPELMTRSAYNLGWDGTAIDMHLALLKVLEANNKLPETILLNLDKKVVFDTGVEYIGIEELSVFYNDYDWIRAEINRQSKYNSALYFLQTYKFNGKMIPLFNPLRGSLDLSLRGYDPIKPDSKAPEKIKKLIKRKNARPELQRNGSLGLNPTFVSNFEKVLKIVQEHNIRLVVFSPPTFGPRSFHHANQELYYFMCERGIPYLDYRNHYRIDLNLLSDTTLWKDLSHLNSLGAETFSKFFNNDIQSILTKAGHSPEALINCDK